MRKFRFKLEAVEKVRKSKERDALRDLATAQRALQAEKERKNLLLKNLESSLSRREQWASLTAQSNVLAVEEDFIQGTKYRIQQTELAIRRAERHLEKSMAFYLTCRQQLRMIEKLRSKALAQFKEEQLSKEAKQLDDLYIMRSRYQNGEEEDVA